MPLTETQRAFAIAFVLIFLRSVVYWLTLAVRTTRPFRISLCLAAVAFDIWALTTIFPTIQTGVLPFDWLGPTLYALGSLSTIDILILSGDPLLVFRRAGQLLPASSDAFTFLQRIEWSFDLISSRRGIAWNFQVAHVRQYDGPSSVSGFATMRILSIVKSLTVHGIIWMFIDYFSIDTKHFSQSTPMTHKAATIFAWEASLYLYLHIVYQSTTLLAVMTRLSIPERCPDVFGSVLDAYTIRRVWGWAGSF